MSTERYHHLDTLRALLMLLGVVIHAAFVYITERSWLVADRDTHRTFDYIVLVINVFRMPGFFFLSGFLFALVLSRQPALGPFVRARVTRICVPLFAAGLLFNVPQLWLFEVYGPEFHGAAVAKNTCDSLARWYEGCWAGHLWFLVTLFYFMVVGVALHWLHALIFQLRGQNMLAILPRPTSIGWPVSVALLAIFGYTVQSLGWRGGASLIDWVPLLFVPWFFQYLPFFLAGFLIQRFSGGVAEWTRVSIPFTVLFVVTWAVLLVSFESSGLARREFLHASRNSLMLYYAVAFQTIFALIAIASRIPNFAPGRARYLTDASYTIYLVHSLLVIALALWLAQFEISIGAKFFVIIFVVLGTSYAIHRFLVCRLKILRFLLNGRIDNA